MINLTLDLLKVNEVRLISCLFLAIDAKRYLIFHQTNKLYMLVIHTTRYISEFVLMHKSYSHIHMYSVYVVV